MKICKCDCHSELDDLSHKIIKCDYCCVSSDLLELMKRIDKIENQNKNGYMYQKGEIDASFVRIKALESRVGQLEGHYYSDGDLSAIHGQIDNLNNNVEHERLELIKLENDVRSLEGQIEGLLEHLSNFNERLRLVEESIDNLEVCNSTKIRSAFKCPVCEGNGMRPNPLVGIDSAEMPVNLDCAACNGKGVLWD